MGKKKFFLTLGAFLLLSGPNYAQDIKDLRKSVMTKALTTFDPTPDQRKSFAAWIEAECNAILKKTPSLSPREQDWLKKEYSEGRLDEAYHSPENSKKFIRENAEKCRNSAQWIQRPKSERHEFLLWGVLVSALLGDDWKWHINNARNKGGAKNLSEDDARNAFLFSTYGKRFLDYIIVPYLSKP